VTGLAAGEEEKKEEEVIMEERLYDLIFIIRPATPEEEIKKVLATIEHACAEKGGKIEKTEHWGTRKLAYKVMKHREGIYVYQQVCTNWSAGWACRTRSSSIRPCGWTRISSARRSWRRNANSVPRGVPAARRKPLRPSRLLPTSKRRLRLFAPASVEMRRRQRLSLD